MAIWKALAGHFSPQALRWPSLTFEKLEVHCTIVIHTDQFTLGHVVGGVMPGKDLHHGPHLHPPLTFRSPEGKVRLVLQVLGVED